MNKNFINANRITPDSQKKGHIYLGGVKALKKNFLIKKKIKSILTILPKDQVSIYPIPKDLKITQLIIPAEDNPFFSLLPYFDKAANFIKNSIEFGNIFVHCYAGVSRSTSCLIAYYVKYEDKGVLEALGIIQKERKCAHPNFGFGKQLREFEGIVRKRKSVLGKISNHFFVGLDFENDLKEKEIYLKKKKLFKKKVNK